MNIKIKKLHPDAVIPTYATNGAACFDLHSIWECFIRHENSVPIPIGLAFEIPVGHVMLIFSRSGHGFAHNVRLSNCVGVIDSDYRGEVMVKLHKDESGSPMEVRKGDRIAQAMIIPIKQVDFSVVDELSETDRGEGGFGSTGV